MKKILISFVLSTVCICAYADRGDRVTEVTTESCARLGPTYNVEQKKCAQDKSSVGKKCDADGAVVSGTCHENTVWNKPDRVYYSCPALICDSNHALLLWDNFGGRRTVTDVKDMIPYGFCADIKSMDAKCSANGKCPKDCRGNGGKCVLNYFTYQHKDYGETFAYYGRNPCACVYPNKEEVLKGCKYKFEGTLTCGDGTSIKFGEPERDVTKEELQGKFCDNEEDRKVLVKELYEKDLKKHEDKFEENCKEHGGYKSFSQISTAVSTVASSAGNVSASTAMAQRSLNEFFNYAESNRSAWKTAEGKFNATRLASDLTAGVVLGTVGGVVSGVVIKKNQVKKGFEALSCGVGGQKVAEWGDEFRVGLQK